MAWTQEFADPIILADGRILLTLHDAADYVVRLRKVQRDAPQWQLAAEWLILIGNHGGDPMAARIAMMRAINHGKPGPEKFPRRKRAKAYRIIR